MALEKGTNFAFKTVSIFLFIGTGFSFPFSVSFSLSKTLRFIISVKSSISVSKSGPSSPENPLEVNFNVLNFESSIFNSSSVKSKGNSKKVRSPIISVGKSRYVCSSSLRSSNAFPISIRISFSVTGFTSLTSLTSSSDSSFDSLTSFDSDSSFTFATTNVAGSTDCPFGFT